MKELKIVSYQEVEDRIGMKQEFWDSVRGLPAEERLVAMRKELEASWDKDFLAMLKGKTLEEQMEYYCIVESSETGSTAYGEVTKSNVRKYGRPLKDYEGLRALIVEDGVIIGVGMSAFACRDPLGSPAFPYQVICTYYASDDNGSGSKDREDCAYLCPVKPEA